MDNKKAYYIEGFDEEKAIRDVRPIFSRFYKSYATKSQDLDIQDWLFARLKEELPNRKDSDIHRISRDIVDGVRNFDEDLKSIDASCEKGLSKEQWLANSLEKSSADLDINEYGNYLAEIDKNLALNNAQAMKAITAKAGENPVNVDLAKNQDLVGKQEDKDWNTYSTKALALNVGKQVVLSGVTGCCMETGSYIDPQSFTDNDPEVQDFVSNSIESGIDFGLKVATTGALEVAVEKGIFPFLKNTPAGILSSIGSGIVENCKTAWKFVTGKINGHEALDRVGRVAVAQAKCVVDTILLKKENCEKIGETIGSIWGPAGAKVGKAIGTVVSTVANTDVGKAIGEGIKKIAKPAVDCAKNCWNSIKKTAGEWLDNTRKAVSNGLKKVGTAIASFFGF